MPDRSSVQVTVPADSDALPAVLARLTGLVLTVHETLSDPTDYLLDDVLVHDDGSVTLHVRLWDDHSGRAIRSGRRVLCLEDVTEVTVL